MSRFNPPKLNKTTLVNPPEQETPVHTEQASAVQSEVPPMQSPVEIGVEDGIYKGRFVYAPEKPDETTLRDVVELLMAVGLIIDHTVFDRLPSGLKYQFVWQDRQGKNYRYGSREYNVKTQVVKK